MPAKIATVLLWAACLVAVVLPLDSPLYDVGFWTLIVLICGHSIECLLVASRVMKAPGNILYHFAMILVFGFFHWNTLPK